MKSKRPPSPNRIAEFRKAKKLTQQELADRIGSHWITISKLERGVMRLSDEWRQLIAKALDVAEWDLAVEGRRLPEIHFDGVIDDDGKAVAFTDEIGRSFRLSTSLFTSPGFRWLLVDTDTLYPLYQAGDRLCLWQVNGDEIDQAVGRPGLFYYNGQDGEIESLFGTFEGRSPNGLYTLGRFNLPPLRDVALRNAEIVTMAIYDFGADILELKKLTAMDIEPEF